LNKVGRGGRSSERLILGMGPIESKIFEKVKAEFQPLRLELENESHRHNFSRGPEGHFKLLVISGAFQGLRSMERHQKIFALLKSEMDAGVHALTIKAMTPEESEKLGVTFDSPACQHGLKDPR
jgi:stress-induced morphogen